MKKIINIVSYLLILSVIYIAVINASETLNLHLWGIKDSSEILGMVEYTKNLNLASYTFIVLVIGLFTGICWMGQFYLSQKEKLIAYKRELEKSSITNSSSTSKVEILEAKIATLEKALEDAINKS